MTDHPEHPHVRPDPTDAPALVSDLIRHGTRLIGDEIRLAKKEVSMKLKSAVAGIAMIILAGFLVLSVLDVLSAAAVAALAELGLPVSVSSLIVAGVAIVAAIILFMAGKSRLSSESLTPDKSIKNVRRDIETIKENAHV
ncbi:phage holin family protein [Roseobacter sp.]|uniref:phage holin family protein n=1 Tax=Roseobacter sp. TaxID=1907202 RepID=UPI0025EA9810|nr:phage holin family protein [Roseobacter sp.]